MLRGILGRKIGMTQIFAEKGECIPVTLIETGPQEVVRLKTLEKDGYQAAVLGFQAEEKLQRLNKPDKGQFKGTAFRHLREFSLENVEGFESGTKIDLNMFSLGEKVNISGTSKGKGFQGVIKRHNFKGGPASHGSRFHRTPGSIGNRTDPGRVFPGKKLPGHMGAKRVTIANLTLLGVYPEKNLLVVKGQVPSHNGAVVEIHKQPVTAKKEG